MMTSLPDDRQKRNELLDSAQARPAPENQKQKTAKEQRVETTAATFAALMGILFSTSDNVMLGAGTPIDENQLVDPSQRERKSGKNESDGDDEDGERLEYDATQLVPWLRLVPPPPRDAQSPR